MLLVECKPFLAGFKEKAFAHFKQEHLHLGDNRILKARLTIDAILALMDYFVFS